MKWLLLLAIVMGVCSAARADGPLKIIPLHHRFAQDVLPSLQPLLGEDDVVSAVANNVLVRTSSDRLETIERAIAMLDVERKTLRISISRHRMSEGAASELGVSGSMRRGNVVVGTSDYHGRVARGAEVELGQRDFSTTERASEFVSVLENERAVISVGQSVPFSEIWAVLTQRYARIQQTVQFQEITTGFAVRPRPIGDEIELEIAPRVASLSGGVIDFEALATTVRVHPGLWVDLGGTMQSHDDVSRQIFSTRASNGYDSTQLWVKVD